MANTQNRGNSSGTSSNMPNGITRTTSNSNSNTSNQSSRDYVDAKILNSINIMTKKYETYIKRMYGSLEGFEEAIEKATKTALDSAKKEKDTKEKYNKELDAMAQQYGKNSIQYKRHLKEFNKGMDKVKHSTTETLLDVEKSFIKQSFKNETKAKQIKYLDNRYSKNNNLASANNEYYSNLEKLKSSALDTYGKDFEKNKEYKKALMNLNDHYAKEMKDAWKKDFKENHKILGGISEGIKDTFDKNKEAIQGLLGPLNLIIAPIKDFFGGFGLIFKGIKGGAKWLFGKFNKKNPTANDVIKSGAYGVGSLYIANTLQKLFGKTKGTNLDDEGAFKTFLEGASAFNKVVNSPIFQSLATVGGLALVVKDAIAGWKKGEEWGVPNWEAMVGSIVGGTGSGGNNAVKGAIKYALLGASFGPFGILAGAILGGVLGFFGGEFWAQGLDDFKNLITGKKSLADLQKEDLLKDIDKKKNKNQITQLDYDTFQKLSKTLSSEDFASLGDKNGKNGKGVVSQWIKGNLDSLSDAEIASFLKNHTGLNINESNLGAYKNVFSWMENNLNDSMRKSIFKDRDTLKAFLLNIESMGNAYKRGDTKFFDDYGGQDSELYQNLLASGFFNLRGSARMLGLGELDSNSVKKANKRLDLIWDNMGGAFEEVEDAIIRTDGKIIKTNPKDTLVALKDVPLSIDKVRQDSNKNLNSSLSQLDINGTIDKQLTTIIDVLSKILVKEAVILPPQTRNDLDMLMNGGMI